MLTLKLEQIKANTWNCNFLGAQERSNLKQRMNQDGPQKTLPIVVRKTDTGYEIVDGEHRWTIAKELGWENINAIEREADDLQSRALCIGYNRWRGRLNWFKLYEVVKKDADAGIDLVQAYQEALSNQELQWILALGNLVPEAKKVLEEALKKHPEITLEQLYILSLFPASQQSGIVEKFKTPVVAQALTHSLTQFTQKTQTQTKETPNQNNQPPTALLKDTTPNNLSKNAFKSTSPQECYPTFHAKTPNTQYLSSQNIDQQDKSNPNLSAISQGTNLSSNQGSMCWEVGRALLLAVGYTCDCGRHYHVNFKNLSIVVQKENLLFEHVNIEPHVFLVRCRRCNSEHEFAVEEETKVKIFCRRCKPTPREGLLDVNAGEVTWFG
ncbi:MAG: ParB/RepB/Spo0J family partition protein [Candidatus Bathyarchaeota archaeon]|nr:ParB/RepB/Spo0J family partition protein [Candidatus Termiticorpusculum sp.]